MEQPGGEGAEASDMNRLYITTTYDASLVFLLMYNLLPVTAACSPTFSMEDKYLMTENMFPFVIKEMPQNQKLVCDSDF